MRLLSSIAIALVCSVILIGSSFGYVVAAIFYPNWLIFISFILIVGLTTIISLYLQSKELKTINQNYHNTHEAVKVKYYSNNIKHIWSTTYGDWVDLHPTEYMELKKDTHINLPLGMGIELPTSYEAMIILGNCAEEKGIGSSTGIKIMKNTDLSEWTFPIYAYKDAKLSPSDVICKFRIVSKNPSIKLNTQ